jgi:branched-chain amino acid aminotransferase
VVEKVKYIWMDGKRVDWDQATVHVLTHSLHYGMGAFEGIRSYKGADGRPAVFRLAEHVRRLFDSAHIAGIQIPYTQEQIGAACIETLAANGLEEGYIRPLVYLGAGSMGVYPVSNPVRVSIAVWKWGAYLGEEALKKGIRCRVSSFTRYHTNTIMTAAKLTGNYSTSVLAKTEAVRDGYDEAILMDPHGYVAEGSGENIFIVRDGQIKTTPLTTILPGITRDSVITLARDLGFAVAEQPFRRDELYVADEAFFTGTAAEVTPIREVDNRTIGAGKPGPVTQDLQKAFFDAVRGRSSRYAAWLTPYEVRNARSRAAVKARE